VAECSLQPVTFTGCTIFSSLTTLPILSDCPQELLHKDLEAAELEMQREFESLLQGRGAWGDVASAREAEDEGEDEGEVAWVGGFH
jgi:hypothetical protein